MRKQTIVRLALAWLMVSIAVPPVSTAQDTAVQGTTGDYYVRYREALAQADTLVRAGRYPEALAQAQSAIQLAPNQFKPYYYAAFALYKQEQFEGAERYARDSLARANGGDREDVQKLVDAIGTRRLIAQKVTVADAALKNGLFAKAAEAYTEAWQSSPDLAEPLGLKAAHLWFESISDPVKAAAILNYIVAHPQDPGKLQEARSLLGQMQSTLAANYKNDLAEAITYLNYDGKSPNTIDKGILWLKLAAEAEPREQEPHFRLLAAYFVQGKYEEATNEVATLARLGVTAHDLTSWAIWKSSMYQLALDPTYSARIRDTLGPTVVEQARQLAAERDASNHAAQQTQEFDRQLGQFRDDLKAIVGTIGKVQVGSGKIKHLSGGLYCNDCMRHEYELLSDGICPSLRIQIREVSQGGTGPDGNLKEEMFDLLANSVGVKEVTFPSRTFWNGRAGDRALEVGPFLFPTSSAQVAGKLSSVLNDAKRVCAAKSALAH